MVRLSDLTGGKIKSCGCLRKEIAAKSGQTNAVHGLTKTRIWNIWSGMKRRCVSNPNYRSVTVCQEWMDFRKFYSWSMENGYSDYLTLDRIDVYGNYTPDNCRWATHRDQENNRRNNHFLEICGCKKTISEWSDAVGVNAATISYRIKHQWPMDQIFTPPNNKKTREGDKHSA
jgi:hypothetical protein